MRLMRATREKNNFIKAQTAEELRLKATVSPRITRITQVIGGYLCTCAALKSLRSISNFPAAFCRRGFIMIPIIARSRLSFSSSVHHLSRSRYRRNSLTHRRLARRRRSRRYIVVNALIDGVDLWMRLLINWAIRAKEISALIIPRAPFVRAERNG